jgi:hypothetical protein
MTLVIGSAASETGCPALRETQQKYSENRSAELSPRKAGPAVNLRGGELDHRVGFLVADWIQEKSTY